MYRKNDDVSYALGAYVTMELLKNKPDQVQRILISSQADGMIDLAQAREVVVADRALKKLSGKENCYVAGVFKKYSCHLDDQENHVVLVNPSNMGNLGTIMRTMLGFGVRNLALIAPACDIFDPKVIRSSMGALFSLNFAYFSSFAEYLCQYPRHFCYPFMLDGKISLDQVQVQKPYALIFGNEAKGLDASFQNLGQSVVISHLDTIDSLNLAMSCGIALYQFTKGDFV